MGAVFELCFYVGAGLSIAGFLLGHFFDFIDVDGLNWEIDLPGMNMLPLSPMIYLIFLTVFGGLGMICLKFENPLPMSACILIAFAAAVFVSCFVWKIIIKPLKKAQNTSAPDMEELIGVLGRVHEKILKNGFGEITYCVHGNTFTSPAKALNGGMLKAGEEIVICEIKDGVFYVTPFNNE